MELNKLKIYKQVVFKQELYQEIIIREDHRPILKHCTVIFFGDFRMIFL